MVIFIFDPSYLLETSHVRPFFQFRGLGSINVYFGLTGSILLNPANDLVSVSCHQILVMSHVAWHCTWWHAVSLCHPSIVDDLSFYLHLSVEIIITYCVSKPERFTNGRHKGSWLCPAMPLNVLSLECIKTYCPKSFCNAHLTFLSILSLFT